MNVIYCKEHSYIHIGTIYKEDSAGPYLKEFTRIDRFYCEYCLDEKEVVKTKTGRECPVWYVR